MLNARFNRDLAVVGGEEAASPLLDFTKNDIMRGVELLVLLVTGLLLIVMFYSFATAEGRSSLMKMLRYLASVSLFWRRRT